VPQQHSSGIPRRPPVYQGRRPFLLSQHLGPGFPSGLHREPENQARQTVGRKHPEVLEGHGHARLSPVGQCTDLPRQYPLPSILWSGNQTVPVLRRHAGVHSHRRTLAQRGDRKLQRPYNKKFFRRQWFPSYANLKRQSKNFQRFHNKHHRYSCLKGKTPNEYLEAVQAQPLRLPAAKKLPKLDVIPDGQIVLIRFIRSNLKLDIFGESFPMPVELKYSYVKAVINTSAHTLSVYLGEDFVTSFSYPIPVCEGTH